MMYDIAVLSPFTLSPFLDELRIPPHTQVPPGLGGTPVVHLVRGLIDRGYRVLVLTSDPTVDTPITLRGTNLEVRVGQYRIRGRARDLFRLERSFLAGELATARVPLAHAHWTYEFAMSALSTAVPTLVSAHDAPMVVLRHDPTPYRVARTIMARIVCRRAERMTAVSNHVSAHLVRWFGAPTTISVVPNGVPIPQVTGTPTSDAEEDLAAPVFGAVGSWAGLKNIRGLLTAFAYVRRDIPAAKLRLFGPGLEASGPAASWARSNYADRGVDFVGKVPNVTLLKELGLLDVLVHPSLEEAHPMAIVEAMARGVAVIGGMNSGGVPETIANDAGILVDVRNPASLAQAMVRLAWDATKRREYGRNGLVRALARYSVAAMIDGYEQEYALLNTS